MFEIFIEQYSAAAAAVVVVVIVVIVVDLFSCLNLLVNRLLTNIRRITSPFTAFRKITLTYLSSAFNLTPLNNNYCNMQITFPRYLFWWRRWFLRRLKVVIRSPNDWRPKQGTESWPRNPARNHCGTSGGQKNIENYINKRTLTLWSQPSSSMIPLDIWRHHRKFVILIKNIIIIVNLSSSLLSSSLLTTLSLSV